MTTVAILGAGKIGSAVYKILSTTHVYPYSNARCLVFDANEKSVKDLNPVSGVVVDFFNEEVDAIAEHFIQSGITHVINALPFFLNEKVAKASAQARCSYIDFTEDDVMADKVQEIYKDTGLNCAVKCGLAPGFINYVGYSLVKELDETKDLTICVGALPRTVSFSPFYPELAYNLTWSVDGLVNEYIRPCRVKTAGEEREILPLRGLTTVILDGTNYEAAYTSGGVGSLVRDLKDVPNVCYKTIRYPGHYGYVSRIIDKHKGDFDAIKKKFQEIFPTTDDDVIVVYAEAIGKLDGQLTRKTFYNKFYGVDSLTGIQATTAGSGVAILELMLTEDLNGIINHTDVSLAAFKNTTAFKKCYKTSK